MTRAKKAIEHRACPNQKCEAHVATSTDERPAIGRCFGCGKRYSIWGDESVHALCACGKAHDERGHPYTVGEARLYFEDHGERMEEYGRNLFAFLLEKAETESPRKARRGR